MVKNQESRLRDIRTHFENLLDKTQARRGVRQSIGEIEGEILGDLLKMGKLLFSERIEHEENYLESEGYEVVGEKNQEASRSL